MTYLINFLVVPLYYLFIGLVIRNKKQANKLFFLLVCLHAILFRALANPYLFVDTERYSEAYSIIAGWNFKDTILTYNYYTPWGHGYLALNWLLSRISSDPTLLFVFVSIISVSGVIIYYYKSSYTFFSSICLFLLYPMMYLMGFGVIRQHLSVVFILWALYYIDKLKISLTLTLIGALFHTGAIIVIPFILFYRYFEVKKVNIVKLLFFSIVGFVILRVAVQYVLSFFPRYLDVVEFGSSGNNIVPAILIGSTLVVLFLSHSIGNINVNRDKSLVLFLFYGLAVALFSIGFPGAGRLTLYHIYTLPIATSFIYKYTDAKYKSFYFIYMVFLFASTIFLISAAMSSDNWTFDKYVYIWEYLSK